MLKVHLYEVLLKVSHFFSAKNVELVLSIKSYQVYSSLFNARLHLHLRTRVNKVGLLLCHSHIELMQKIEESRKRDTLVDKWTDLVTESLLKLLVVTKMIKLGHVKFIFVTRVSLLLFRKGGEWPPPQFFRGPTVHNSNLR